MSLDMKGMVIIAVAAVGIAAGAYTLGTKQGKQATDDKGSAVEAASSQPVSPTTPVVANGVLFIANRTHVFAIAAE